MKDIIFYPKGVFFAKCSSFNNDTFKASEVIVRALGLKYDVESFDKIKTIGANYCFIPSKDLNFKKGEPQVLQELGNLEVYWLGVMKIEITEDILAKIIKNFDYISEE